MIYRFRHSSPALMIAVAAGSCSSVVAVVDTSCGGSPSTVGSDSGLSQGPSLGGVSADSSTMMLDGAASFDASPGSPSSSSSGGSEAGPLAPPPPPSPTAGIGPGCTPVNGNSGGTLGQGECTMMYEEACGDASYQTTCACPQGTCACFGASTTVVNFQGCPTCPTTAEAFALCGFPH